MLKQELEQRLQVLENADKEKTYQLRQSQIKYETIVENSSDGILVVQDGYVRFANQKCLDVTGYHGEEYIGKRIVDLIHPEDRAKIEQRNSLRRKGMDVPSVYTLRPLRSDGNFLWAEVSAVETVWEGRPATLNLVRDVTEREELLASFLDVTRQKEMMEEMRQPDKLSSLGQLAAGLAHELRNPLAVVSSCSQFCLDNMSLDRLLKENFQVIHRNAKRASELINDLLAFARPAHFE